MRATIDNLGIPPLAGLCTYDEACQPGYSVDKTVSLLKRYNYLKTRLNELFATHLAHIPEWEVKCAFSLHLWLEAEHSAWLRQRVTEMREPPHYLDEAPDERLQTLFAELIRAENTLELLVGVYGVVKPAIIEALKQHVAQTNPLIDHPTCRLLRFIITEEEEMVAWGKQAIAALTRTPEDIQRADAWKQHISWYLDAAGGVSGAQPTPESLAPTPRSDGSPYQADWTPRRDQRFTDPFNRAAKVDEYYREETRDLEERICALLYKRLREIDVPEWMGRIIVMTRGKPWEYYLDLSRQLWDEARHSMMGEAGFYAKGVPFYRYPLTINASYVLNKDFEPLEAHVLLWGIEQGLMPRETGKRWEWEIAKASHDDLVTSFQDYDWADEVLHAQIGRKWLIPHYGSRNALLAVYEELRERWGKADVSGLSEQKQWWSDFMAEIYQNRELAESR
jgi:hypothetical protein